MKKFMFLSNNRFAQLTPLLVALMSIILGYAISVLHVAEKYCDFVCQGSIWEPVMFFGASALLGTISLLFVRVEIIRTWLWFSLAYISLTAIYISQQSVGSAMGPGERVMYTTALGALFSVITILWAIIHSFILRKKPNIS